MKYLNLSIITLCAVFLSACSNDNNPTPDPAQTLPQVKSITVEGMAYANLAYNDKGQIATISFVGGNVLGGGRVDKFSYNASGKLTKAVNVVDSTQYTYSADGRLQQSDSFTEWKLSPTGSGMDFRTTYAYNANGKIASTTVSDGTKQGGQTTRFTVTYEYTADGALSALTYKQVDDAAGQKFVVDAGYTDAVKLNPLILERVTSLNYYFGVGGIAQLAAKFPKAIRNYDSGQVVEGYGFTFTTSNDKVTKLSALLKLPNSESTTNYEFQY